MSEHKTWLSMLMEDSETLLKQKLKELNEMDPEDVDEDDICMMKNAYKAIYYMESIKKHVAETESK